MVPVKVRIIFGVLIAIGMISLAGMAIEESQAQKSIPEIEVNQQISVEDKIYRTIHVELEDGIASFDDLR
jgi:hypothetical protein